MIASERFVSAAFDLSRRHSVSDWIEPRSTRLRREELATLIPGKAVSVAPFEYDPTDTEGYLTGVARLRDMVELLDEDVRPLATRYVDSTEARAMAIASCDDAQYSSVVARLDGVPDADLVGYAMAILEAEPTTAPAGTVTDIEAAAAIRESFALFHLDGWTVEVHEQMSAAMSVNGPLKRIRVRRGASFSPHELRRLLVHEVGGHALRWKLSGAQPERLAWLPIGRTVPTEEGLALWNEYRHGLLDNRALRTYAARVIAVDTSRSAGILEVARTIAPYVGTDLAAQTAMRVKRGLSDPNGPGGATKDWSYLGGLQLIKEIARDTPSDINLLLGVKWGVDCLPTARALAETGRIRPPELPSISMGWNFAAWSDRA